VERYDAHQVKIYGLQPEKILYSRAYRVALAPSICNHLALLETRIILWVTNFSVRFFRYAQKNYDFSVGFKISRQKNTKTLRDNTHTEKISTHRKMQLILSVL